LPFQSVMPVPSPATAAAVPGPVVPVPVLSVPRPAAPSLAWPAGAPDPFTDVRIGVLTSVITPELVAEVIEATGCREQRRRLLPSDVVIYLVLGMCLLSGADAAGPPGCRQGMRKLSRGLRQLAGAALPTRQAFGRRRQKLGAKPLELLFDRSRGPRAPAGMAGAFAFGRRLLAWDATTLGAPLTDLNLAGFGVLPGGSRPALRLLAVIECGTHALIEAAFDGVSGGSGRSSEYALARRVLHALREGMLLLADQNFRGYELWADARSGGADLIWRITDNRVLPPVEVLADGSYLAVLPTPQAARQGCKNRAAGTPPEGCLVRVIDYTVTVTAAGGQTSTESFRLATSLLDPDEAPAPEIAALYHERWECEGTYQELKTRLKGAGFTLRSRSPELVCQELWAMLTVYHALCALEAGAAAIAGLDPGRISFAITVHAVRDQVCGRDVITVPGVLDRVLGWVAADILGEFTEPRRDRRNERKTNPEQRKYGTRHPAEPRPPSNVTFTVTIDTRRTTSTGTSAGTRPSPDARPPPPAKTP